MDIFLTAGPVWEIRGRSHVEGAMSSSNLD
jgi:hypothetical protein